MRIRASCASNSWHKLSAESTDFHIEKKHMLLLGPKLATTQFIIGFLLLLGCFGFCWGFLGGFFFVFFFLRTVIYGVSFILLALSTQKYLALF